MSSIDDRIASGNDESPSCQFIGGKNRRDYMQYNYPNDGGHCVDEMAFFVVHVDGIQCATTSGKANDFLCLTLELVNCNECDRESRSMTLFSCVMQNRKDQFSKQRFLSFLDEYILLNSAAGKAGVYMWYNGEWHHWRWCLAGICADSVAQEEVMEFVNKKMSSHPCWFDEGCKRQRLNLSEYMLQEMNAPSIQGMKSSLSILPPASLSMHECCGYRLMGFLAHCKEKSIVELMEGFGKLSAMQEKEVLAVRSLFNLFPECSLCQWMPISTNPLFMYYWRKEVNEKLFLETVRGEEGAMEEQGEEGCISTTCLQEMVLQEEGVNETAFVSKECKRYMGGIDVLTSVPRIASPEKFFPMPSKYCRTIDSMHLVKNTVLAFLQFFYRRRSMKDVMNTLLCPMLAGVVSPASLMNEAFPRLQVPKWVLDCAAKRLQEISKTKEWDYVSPDILIPSVFSSLKTHDCLVFAFSLFPYVFQDSYCVPAVFAAVNIMEAVECIFSFSGDLRELSEAQALIGFFLSMFQGEVAATDITISLHTLCHLAKSIRFSGNADRNNCFNQEYMYQFPKIAMQAGCNPSKRIQKILRVQHACSIFNEKEKQKEVETEVACPAADVHSQWIKSHIDTEVYKTLTKWNAYDDSVFFDNDLMEYNTLFDQVVKKIRDKCSGEEIKSLISSYVNPSESCRRVYSGYCLSHGYDL